MQTVQKYPIPTDDYFSLKLPRDAEILTIQAQRGDAFIWALVNPNAPLEPRHFRLAGTGHPIAETDQEGRTPTYINTFQLEGGSLVFHLFEMKYNLEEV